MKIANAYCRDKTRKLPKNIAWLTFPKRIKNKKTTEGTIVPPKCNVTTTEVKRQTVLSRWLRPGCLPTV